MRISDWSSDVCSSDLRIALAVPVTASISGRCGFSTPPDTNVELANLEAGFSRDIPFVLQCNTPMRLAMVSQNGGLKVASAPPEGRSEERRVGKECGRTCSSRGVPDH